MANGRVARLLAHDFVQRHPSEAAGYLESIPAEEAADLVSQLKPRIYGKAFRLLATATALDILSHAEPKAAGELLLHLAAVQAGGLLDALPQAKREIILGGMSEMAAGELRRILAYPAESAGRLRDPKIAVFLGTTTVRDAFERLRAAPVSGSVLNFFVIDEDGRLAGLVPLHEAAVAEPSAALASLIQAPPITVSPFAGRAEVVETMERNRLTSLPVVGPEGTPIGVLRLHELLRKVGEEHSADLVSITGAGKEETALSSAGFAVRKRLPWLQVNLLTAFAAAAVVGIFEETIARFTALAVLLPVVAGQSGNTGSQALAVVLRGLALREIGLRSWPKVAMKELAAGALNGVGVSIVTCAGVYVWSGSTGLVLVIGAAMILSMTLAGVAGAIIPVLLAALGQDPAQSSSIFLTTVTDIVGFLSFLGLATVFSGLL